MARSSAVPPARSSVARLEAPQESASPTTRSRRAGSRAGRTPARAASPGLDSKWEAARRPPWGSAPRVPVLHPPLSTPEGTVSPPRVPIDEGPSSGTRSTPSPENPAASSTERSALSPSTSSRSSPTAARHEGSGWSWRHRYGREFGRPSHVGRLEGAGHEAARLNPGSSLCESWSPAQREGGRSPPTPLPPSSFSSLGRASRQMP